MCEDTEHKIKSTMGGIVLVLAMISHMLTLFQDELNRIMRMIIIVIDKSNSCIDTEHEMKLEIKQECWLLIIESLVWIVDMDIKKETSNDILQHDWIVDSNAFIFLFSIFKHESK